MVFNVPREPERAVRFEPCEATVELSELTVEFRLDTDAPWFVRVVLSPATVLVNLVRLEP